MRNAAAMPLSSQHAHNISKNKNKKVSDMHEAILRLEEEEEDTHLHTYPDQA